VNTRAERLLEGGLAVGAWTALITEGLIKAHDGLPLLAYPLAAIPAVSLGFCRRAPLVSLLGVEVGAILWVALFYPAKTAIGVVMVSLFTVALLGDRWRSLAVGAITGTALCGTLLLLDDDAFEIGGTALRLLLLLSALVVGDTVRSRQAVRALAVWQASHRELIREEETRQRLVAERLRIARDLHDTLAHALVAINVRAGVAAYLRNVQDPAAALLDIKDVSAGALRDLRVTLHLLHTQDEVAPVVPAPDLSAIAGLLDGVRAGGLSADLRIDVDAQVVPSPVGQAAFRIVQEALTNVLRHANASSTQVDVAVRHGVLHVRVTDDGAGGRQGGSGSVGETGHGLRGMAQRAAVLGGAVSTGPRAEGGWQVRARLPLSMNEVR
jgi:signal transduction histidine kinase